MDTIFALATARGKSGVAIVRISGPLAFEACTGIAGSLPASRNTALRKLVNPDGVMLDEALVLTFDAGHSFTGEDVVEFQLHGSVAVVNAVLAVLGGIEGLRIAEPGEFTRRALENERLDIAQVEGLADLIEAETELQRRQALRVFSGDLGDKVEGWRTKLIRAAALLEATIDFVDEDVPVDVSPEVEGLIDAVTAELKIEIKGADVAERIRDGFEVAIVGAPNVGKSTLLNLLAGRDAAITSDIAGTTRDVIEVRMDLAGLPVTFLDTAGLRETSDAVEAIGVRHGLARAKAADLRVFLTTETGLDIDLKPKNDDILVCAKSDIYPGNGFRLSAKTGEGISELIERISEVLSARASLPVTATRARHRAGISDAARYLESARDLIKQGPEVTDLAAEELRSALRSLNSLVGRVDVEDVLDRIFADFCIGK